MIMQCAINNVMNNVQFKRKYKILAAKLRLGKMFVLSVKMGEGAYVSSNRGE